MRQAVCSLIAKICDVVPEVYASSVDGRAKVDLALRFLEEVLASGKNEMVDDATAAYTALCTHVISRDKSWHSSVAKHVEEKLRAGGLPEEQRGFALVAGCVGGGEVSAEIFRSLTALSAKTEDVEVRRNIAVSLGRQANAFTAPLIHEVLSALTTCMEDYSTDKRGDIGSTVREAAMKSATHILRKHYARDTGTDKSADSMPISGEDNAEDNDIALPAEVLLKVLQNVVRQCSERIDRTRVVAGNTLRAICAILAPQKLLSSVSSALHDIETAFRLIPEVSEETAPSEDEVKFQIVEEVFPAAVSLLTSPSLRQAVLKGLVASAGGMGHQSKAALAALEAHCASLETTKERRALANDISSLCEGAGERLVVPSLAVLLRLLQQEYLHDLDEELSVSIAKRVRRCWRGKLSDVPRVSAAVGVLSEVATLPCGTFNGVVQRTCIEALVVVLPGPVANLRITAAESLYILIMDSTGPDGLPEVSQALDILSDTEWAMLDIQTAREHRNKFCDLLGVAKPTPRNRPNPTH